ncbi:Zinc finger, C3HC4 type (RING finger) [Musa troglodytarum]|uniref:E3 ubiquitin-protein ligase RMA n=1 Tax=Musa troglodytarum TaxID=320322 RepID=A0A9E7ED37_9LILI|nr:Zinc finger, C3HC4 type (RING finger) [Musa troglodytarum]
MAGEHNASGSSSNRMDLNLYLSLPSLRRSQSRDLGSDLTLSSVHLPWSPIAEETHVSAPYSPSNALSTPDILPADPLHAADNNNPGSEYNPNSSSREPNYAPESQSFDDPYTLPPVHGNEPLIPERSPLVPSQLVPPLQFVSQPSACGVEAQIGYPPHPQLSSRAAPRQVEATLGVYSQIRLSDLTAQGDALSVQQELREHPEYRFQRLIELTNRLWGRNRRPSNDGQRFDSGAHSLTSPERLMHDIVQSQRALEASRKCAEGKEVEYLDKKNEDKSGNAAANFECNICYDLAKDPVVTPCGHLFCWFCLYQWLHAHSVNSECPVCKGHVLEINVTPIYGRGGEETKDHKKCGEDGQSGLKIPPRPHANRIESFRQQVRDRLEEGIANSRRNDVDEEVHDGVRLEGYRPSRRQGRFGAARTLATRRMRRIQREEGTGSNSTGLGLLRDPTSGQPLVPSAVFQDGVDLSRPAGSPTSSLNHHSPEPLHQHSHRVEPVMVSDQASASSSVAVIHGDTTGVNPSAGTSAAGPSNPGRRRTRNSALGSSDVDGVRNTRNRRLN